MRIKKEIILIGYSFFSTPDYEYVLICWEDLWVIWKLIDSDVLRDLVLFVQFEKHEKYPWRSVTFSKVAGWSMGVFYIFRLYK